MSYFNRRGSIKTGGERKETCYEEQMVSVVGSDPDRGRFGIFSGHFRRRERGEGREEGGGEGKERRAAGENKGKTGRKEREKKRGKGKNKRKARRDEGKDEREAGGDERDEREKRPEKGLATSCKTAG